MNVNLGKLLGPDEIHLLADFLSNPVTPLFYTVFSQENEKSIHIPNLQKAYISPIYKRHTYPQSTKSIHIPNLQKSIHIPNLQKAYISPIYKKG